jgi:NAD(P)H dehydrogenase (quinone)
LVSVKIVNEEAKVFAVTGITGNVGSEVARNLLAAGRPVRGVVREVRRSETWAKRGCDLVEADINNAAALTTAFTGADGVFVMVPSNFDPSPDFREARAIAATLRSALDAVRPGRVVYLSTNRRTVEPIEPAHAALHD